jgi:hypothetical protein
MKRVFEIKSAEQEPKKMNPNGTVVQAAKVQEEGHHPIQDAELLFLLDPDTGLFKVGQTIKVFERIPEGMSPLILIDPVLQRAEP